MPAPATPPVPIPAASTILLRDTPQGVEILMQRRREQAGAFAGVLAFPGGKVAVVDHDPAFHAAADLDAASPFGPERALAALRETFEECGILFARAAGETSALAERAALLAERDRLDREPYLWPQLLAEHSLRLAADALVSWARWVTPVFAPKRFDSTFFVAAVPPGQTPIGGHEAEDYLWARPGDILDAAERDEIPVVFVTRMNLRRLRQYRTAAEVLDAARAGPHPVIQPERVETPAGPVMRIPADAPYPIREMPFATASTAVEERRLAKAAAAKP